jgi:ATP-dependent exoDNAse (exonuclease V) beta subunit
LEIRWTAEQIAAITARDDVLLAASAGTGKTTTIVGKILWQLGLPIGAAGGDGQPVPPTPSPSSLDEIGAITFTEKAAHDLKAKLRRAIEATEAGRELRWELDRATVGTIHSFCAELLRDHALRLDVDPTFAILDERETRLEQDCVIREVIHIALENDEPGAVELVKRFGITGWRMQPGAVGRIRDVLRDLRWRPRQYDDWLRDAEPRSTGTDVERELDPAILRQRARFAGAWDAEDSTFDDAALGLIGALYRLARRATHAWLEWLERENLRDFDSLILDTRRLLTRPATRPALEAIQSRYRLLIIDEFQDTDRAQWEIARAVAGVGANGVAPGQRPQLLVVGDPKQSIYRFRGADVGVWNEALGALCADAAPLHLSHNFRSEPRLVSFVNRIGGVAFGETAEAVGQGSPAYRVDYQTLSPAREPSEAAGLEWLPTDDAPDQSARTELEGRLVATRIRQLVSDATVVDPDTGAMRPCEHRDMAILGRRNVDLTSLEGALRSYGIPFYNSATGGLADQQEVLDLVTALRVVDNPFDDRRAFAFLRSPFVGLRDEVLARIGLDSFDDADRAPHPESLLARAEAYLWLVDQGALEWFEAPESPHIGRIERRSLADGLNALRDAQRLVDRADVVELLEGLLEHTGYRLHLELREGASEALANIERFLALLEEYRHLPVGRFLELWDRWGEEDLGLPQARLHSSRDDVVTLSTVHAAKGLEWPIVFLVNTGLELVHTGRLTNGFWTDPDLGPVFIPRVGERGARAERAVERWVQQEEAEAARLLYVAMTRARDRLLVCGVTQGLERKSSFARWLAEELPDAREAHEARHLSGSPDTSGENGRPDQPGRGRPAPAADIDPATGTGRQIDAFGLDVELKDESGQMNLFTPPPRRSEAAAAQTTDAAAPAAEDAGASPPMIIRRGAAAIQTSLSALPASLAWLDGLESSEWPAGVGAIEVPAHRFSTSATEIMMREREPDRWALRYRHGVVLERELIRSGVVDGALPATVRGTLIHGVLERIREAEELASILNETIATTGFVDLENLLEVGSPYRVALESEIEAVVQSPEWEWYLEGEPHRELPFVHLRAERVWVGGALDLYRPAISGAPAGPDAGVTHAEPSLFGPSVADRARFEQEAWIIDFKTHQIEAGEVERTAEDYVTQVRTYREAAEALVASTAESPPRVRIALHFTHPNVAREM